MKLYGLLKLLVTVTLACCTCVGYATEKSQPTEVITYQPTLMNGPEKEGSCWTNSLVVPHPNAWRCMVGNEIFDPCFSTTNKNYVVCGVSPVKQNSDGFTLKLIQPLPKSTETKTASNPWLVELGDKSICTLRTGTLTFVDKKSLQYGCNCPEQKQCKTHSGIFTIDKSQSVWIAQKATYTLTKQGTKVTKIENIPVIKAWH